MSVNQRIKIFQEATLPKQRDFANLIDISEKTLSSLYNGNTKPSFKVIEAILINFPKLNARWLLIGEGEMIDKSDKSEISESVDVLEMNEPPPIYGRNTEGVLENLIRRVETLEKK